MVREVRERRGHGGTQTAERPFFRGSNTLRALTWKRLQQPSSRASTLLTGYFPVAFNTH
jgi:hypothetical protein